MKISHFSMLVALKILLISEAYADGPCCDLDMQLPVEKKRTQSLESLTLGIQKSLDTPTCFNPNMINGKGLPEKKLKELMKNLSDEEVFTRLILAETLASGCASSQTAEAIAWVIKNRVDAKNEKRFGLGRDVVFKDYQFRSSTGDCDVAQTKAFMCPTSVGKDKWQMAQAAFMKTQKLDAKNPIGKKAYQYFFYKHFDQSKNCKKWKGVLPAWVKEGADVKISSLKLDHSCIRVFN